MSAWEDCRALERASRQHLREHLFPSLAFEGRYVHVDKGEMAKKFQATQGDYVMNSDDVTAWRIEHKCEYHNPYGNFFIEMFSNLPAGNPGWLWKLESDFLLYHFIREGHVYLMRLTALRTWLYSEDSARRNNSPVIHRYAHRIQRQHKQKNVTTGYCVKIEDAEAAFNVRRTDILPLILPEQECKLETERALRSGTDDMFRGIG